MHDFMAEEREWEARHEREEAARKKTEYGLHHSDKIRETEKILEKAFLRKDSDGKTAPYSLIIDSEEETRRPDLTSDFKGTKYHFISLEGQEPAGMEYSTNGAPHLDVEAARNYANKFIRLLIKARISRAEGKGAINLIPTDLDDLRTKLAPVAKEYDADIKANLKLAQALSKKIGASVEYCGGYFYADMDRDSYEIPSGGRGQDMYQGRSDNNRTVHGGSEEEAQTKAIRELVKKGAIKSQWAGYNETIVVKDEDKLRELLGMDGKEAANGFAAKTDGKSTSHVKAVKSAPAKRHR